jgi:hypothetical protein
MYPFELEDLEEHKKGNGCAGANIKTTNQF